MTTRKTYTSDMSDAEWHLIEPLLPGPKRLGRKITYPRRAILTAMFYLNRTGCTWRDLPGDFPPYGLVSHDYHTWRRSGLFQAVNDMVRTRLRIAAGRHPQPSAAILDSQSVKTTEVPGERGYDAGKKGKGRKRHLLVDTLGLVLIVVVHVASIQDREGAQLVLEQLPGRFTRLARRWADSAYAGQVIQRVSTLCQGVLESVKRSDNQQGFAVHPHRWIVERTFGWLNRYRRLAKDYERMPQSSEAMIHLALIRLLLARLARKRQSEQHRQHQLLRQAEQAGYFLAA